MPQILTINIDDDIVSGCRDRIDMPYSVLSLILLKWTPDFLIKDTLPIYTSKMWKTGKYAVRFAMYENVRFEMYEKT